MYTVEQFADMMDRTHFYIGEDVLWQAELHLLDAVSKKEGISVSGLSTVLGISKGAVSQTVCRLLQKGMINRAADPKNATRLLIKLTGKGQAAVECHNRLHKKYEQAIECAFSGSDPELRLFLIDFLSKVQRKLEYMKID